MNSNRFKAKDSKMLQPRFWKALLNFFRNLFKIAYFLTSFFAPGEFRSPHPSSPPRLNRRDQNPPPSTLASVLPQNLGSTKLRLIDAVHRVPFPSKDRSSVGLDPPPTRSRRPPHPADPTTSPTWRMPSPLQS